MKLINDSPKINQIYKENYNGIDIMKFISAILIICIHTNPLINYNKYFNFALVDGLARTAVPFFFITSGFLFFKKITMPISSNQNNKANLNKYIKHIFRLYITWSGIYFILNLYELKKINSINLKSMTKLLWDFIFLGSYVHLWYFPALLFSIIIIYFLLKYFSVKNVLIISSVFYFWGLFGNSYYGLTKNNLILHNLYQIYFKFFGTTRNGLFFGLMFVSLGAFISHRNIKSKNYLNFIVVSFLFLFIEVFTLKYFGIQNDYDMLISLIALTYFIFLTCLNIRINDSKIYKYLRSSSTLIYCSHMIFKILISKILNITGLPFLYNNSLLNFILITLCSYIVSHFILLISNDRKFQWLKILY